MTKHRNNTRRGMAMVLVMSALALAAILGVAILAGASLQSQVATNSSLGIQADGLAESGINLAAYYLMYPANAPAGTVGAAGYYVGQSNVSLGSSVNGTVNVAVSQTSANNYSITSIASVGNSTASTVSRTATSTIQIYPGYQILHTVTFSSDTTILAKVTIKGDVQCNGSLTDMGTVTGSVFSTIRPLALLGGVLGAWTAQIPATVQSIPTSAHLNTYDTYLYQGKTYSAVELGSSIANSTTLGPTTSNPAGVYHAKSALSIGSNVTINGSLTSEATVTITGGALKVVASAGFPALVAKGDLVQQVSGTSKGSTFAGVCSITGRVKSASLGNASLTITGPVIFVGSTAIDSGFAGSLIINPDLTRTCPYLDTSLPAPAVKFNSWNQ